MTPPHTADALNTPPSIRLSDLPYGKKKFSRLPCSFQTACVQGSSDWRSDLRNRTPLWRQDQTRGEVLQDTKRSGNCAIPHERVVVFLKRRERNYRESRLGEETAAADDAEIRFSGGEDEVQSNIRGVQRGLHVVLQYTLGPHPNYHRDRDADCSIGQIEIYESEYNRIFKTEVTSSRGRTL